MFQLPATCSLLPSTIDTLLLGTLDLAAPAFLFLTFVPDLLTSRWGFAAKSIGAFSCPCTTPLTRSTYMFVGLRSHLGHD